MGAIISTKAYRKMEMYARTVPNGEIGGLILGKFNKFGDIVVKDAIILRQVKNESHFSIDDEAMMDFTKDADTKQIASVIGWWHSHGKFDTFWSHDDDKCFERLCNLSNQCFGIVVNIKNKDRLQMRCRLDIKTKNNDYVSIDDIQPMVDAFKYEQPQLYIMDERAIMADINANVHDIGDEGFIECPKCSGTGVISQSFFGRLLGGSKAPKMKEEEENPYEEYY